MDQANQNQKVSRSWILLELGSGELAAGDGASGDVPLAACLMAAYKGAGGRRARAAKKLDVGAGEVEQPVDRGAVTG